MKITANGQSILNTNPRKSKQYIKDRVVVTDNGCWEWQHCRLPHGYGRLGITKNKVTTDWLAHRYAYFVWNEDFNPDLCVLHRCDNPPCCNPDHLFQGTHQDNMDDKVSKDRCHSNGGLRGENNCRSILTEQDVIDIRATPKYYGYARDLCEKYGVKYRTVNSVIRGESWKHLL